jgi:hypothetical protein
MKVDDLVSLKKKTKLSESVILTEKDYVGGAPQKRYFTLKPVTPDYEYEPDTKVALAKKFEPVGIGKAVPIIPFWKGKGRKTKPIVKKRKQN